MKISKIKTKKIKDYNPPTTLPLEFKWAPFLKRLPRTLAEKALLVFLGLLLIALIFGGIIFYQYNILVKKREVQIIEEPLQFREKTYQNILQIWQEREKKFQQAELKVYPNPFRID